MDGITKGNHECAEEIFRERYGGVRDGVRLDLHTVPYDFPRDIWGRTTYTAVVKRPDGREDRIELYAFDEPLPGLMG